MCQKFCFWNFFIYKLNPQCFGKLWIGRLRLFIFISRIYGFPALIHVETCPSMFKSIEYLFSQAFFCGGCYVTVSVSTLVLYTKRTLKADFPLHMVLIVYMFCPLLLYVQNAIFTGRHGTLRMCTLEMPLLYITYLGSFIALRLIPVKRELFLSTITKCLLRMRDCCKVNNTVQSTIHYHLMAQEEELMWSQ